MEWRRMRFQSPQCFFKSSSLEGRQGLQSLVHFAASVWAFSAFPTLPLVTTQGHKLSPPLPGGP